MSPATIPPFDFCQFQRFVNNVGGNELYPAFNQRPVLHNDRLTQYGFQAVNDEGNYVAPPLPGVYAITTHFCACHPLAPEFRGSEHLLYIGSSNNMARRIYSAGHWWERITKRLYWIEHMTYVRWIVTEDYLWAEKSLIKTLRPWLNVQHNGKALR